MNFVLHPEADEEFAEAVRYYSEISPELGVRFYREMERLVREICANPARLESSTRLHDGTSAVIFLTHSFFWKKPNPSGLSRSCT